MFYPYMVKIKVQGDNVIIHTKVQAIIVQLPIIQARSSNRHLIWMLTKSFLKLAKPLYTAATCRVPHAYTHPPPHPPPPFPALSAISETIPYCQVTSLGWNLTTSMEVKHIKGAVSSQGSYYGCMGYYLSKLTSKPGELCCLWTA